LEVNPASGVAPDENTAPDDWRLLKFVESVGGFFVGLAVDLDDIVLEGIVLWLGRVARGTLRGVFGLVRIEIPPLDTGDVHTRYFGGNTVGV
jgi:hypothetical protein